MTNAAQRLGRYEIVAEIGKGGFATVYRARDLDLGREVALKVLDPLLTRDPVWVARFRREARTVAALDHPRIVTIYEIGQDEGALFIAMKLVEGGSLRQRLDAQGALAWDEAVQVIRQVAEALDFAHGQGLLHRDLKPANVLLDLRNGAMLTDFGFSRLLADNSLSVSLSGGVVGTPAYIAPEVWEGKDAGPATDVYALGCILYEMVIGQPLFSGATPPAVMLAHFKPLLLPEAWPEGTPPGLGEVLQTALARDPAARYARAGDLAAAVAALSVDRLAEPYAALRAAIAAGQWQQALALAAEIRESQPDYCDVVALERQALAGLEQAARAQSAAQWRAAAEEALAIGDLAAAQLALKQWQSVMPEDPALASAQAQLQARREAAQAAAAREREPKTVVQEARSEQPPVATPPLAPVVPLVAVAPAEAQRLAADDLAGATDQRRAGRGRKSPVPVPPQKRFSKANWLVVFAALMVLAMVIVRVAGSGGSGVGPQIQIFTLDFGSTMVTEFDGMEYVWVPPGEFLMGSGDIAWLASSDEQPLHSVYLDGYWIAKTEVTVAQYRRCVEAGACTEPGSSDGCTYNMVGKETHPVNCVSWEQAAAYCGWAGCRLPTEAEWEKAARGTDGRIYPWGNIFDGSELNFCDINCVYPHRNASANDGYEATAPVGSFLSGASPYGALDMAGNVWEWVADWYDRDYYARSPAQNPSGPEEGVERVLRGGSWDSTVRLVRSVHRHHSSPNQRHISIGFRPARSP